DARSLQLAPARQQVAPDEVIGLLPAFIFLAGILLDVAPGQIGKRASAALGALLGRRVFAARNREHGLGRERAGVGEPDGVGVAEMQPARTAVVAVDALPGLGTSRLHPDGEPALVGVPDQVGLAPELGLLDSQFSEPTLLGCPGRASALAGSGHVNRASG